MLRSCRAEAARRRWLLLAALHATACGAGESGAASGNEAGAQAEPSALYAEVESILARSCAYERCHSGAIVGGALDLTRGGDYRAALVGVEACEYERMARVEPGDAERSWLMVKLTAEFRPAEDPYPFYIRFVPEEGWDPSQRGCKDQTEDGEPLFGQRMPLTAPNMLPEGEIAAIREWIEAGAER